MAKYAYQSQNFNDESMRMIQLIDSIATKYLRQDFILTVRQLYYQLVAGGHIPNTERSYKRITGITNDARMAGLVDWSAIEDRTRSFNRRERWSGGAEIVEACVKGYHEDMWDNQRGRVFVIVEKEALSGVLDGLCHRLDVPLLAARGYPSGTVLREFALHDLVPAVENGQNITILHLGDHDPSGIDMTRDLTDRINTFAEGHATDIRLERIALNMDQIQAQRPPENPAKTTDSRFREYRRNFGDSSWELDALTPQYLNELVEQHIRDQIDDERWTEAEERINEVKTRLKAMAAQFKE